MSGTDSRGKEESILTTKSNPLRTWLVVFLPWLVLVIIWNFGWPTVHPIWDVLVAVGLSLVATLSTARLSGQHRARGS